MFHNVPFGEIPFVVPPTLLASADEVIE